VGQLRKKTAKRAACVNREWQASVKTAKGLGMYDAKILSVATGRGPLFPICVTGCSYPPWSTMAGPYKGESGAGGNSHRACSATGTHIAPAHPLP